MRFYAMKWTTKACIQRTLAQVPGGATLYRLGQFSVGGLRHYRIDRKVEEGLWLLRALTQAGHTLHGRAAMEIGSGWVPVIPMLFWLHGLQSCHTHDVTALLKKSLVVEAARQFVTRYEKPTARCAAAPISLDADRLASLGALLRRQADADAILLLCHIAYHAPVDTAATRHADGTMALFVSNVVLQHVPRLEIRRLFQEAFRLLQPGGLMVHSIDLTDHFSHRDRSISSLNFLTFSEEEFAKYNTHFCYQNRLRVASYRQLIEDAGFDVIHWGVSVNEGLLRHLPHLHIHHDFAGLSPEELCSTSLRVVARRP
jgi:hypothetical protein